MSVSGLEGTPPDGESCGFVLCEQLDQDRSGATIAHLVNRAAERSPGCDIALAFGAETAPSGWEQTLQAVARGESTTATVRPLSALDGGACDGERATLDEALDSGGGALEVGLGLSGTLPQDPRASLVSGPLVYLVRASFDLLGGMDETLVTSAGAVAEFGLRACQSGLANLIASELLVAPQRPITMSDADRAELARRFPLLWEAARDPPTAAVERVFALAKVSAERKVAVTVDARSLGSAMGGTQTYTLELLRALDRTGAVRVRALLAEDALPELAELENTEAITYRAALEEVPATDLVHRPQQVFSVDDLSLLQPLGRRLVVTQLDLIAYHSPTYFPDIDAWHRHVRATRIAMEAADCVLFLSDHARRDAEREDLIDGERAVVVPLGVDPVADVGEVSPPNALKDHDEPFLLCLGSDYAHKNRPYALKLTAALRRDGWPGILVLAGAAVAHGSSAPAERLLLDRDRDLAEAVIDVGVVSDIDRRWLMSHARAVVYPTVLEGFGLIPLEAASAGVPCLFAAQSSLGELLPARLATLDGWDVERSALAARPLLSEGDERAAHVSALRELLSSYTWERCAQLTIEAYHTTLGMRARLSARAAWEARARELEIVRLDRAVGDFQRCLDGFGEDGAALVGPHGLLSPTDQRALLALAARPSLKRSLFAALRGGYRVLNRPRG